MALSPAWLDELRSRITLSALIGRTVKVQRAGREFKACCPFHNEKTPSFTINDEKGFYHCFGCGAHGDAIRWMTDQRGLAFIDAVKELAAQAGMDVPAADPRAAQRAEAQAGLRDVTEAAARWFATELDGPDGAAARAYLTQRGIRPDTLRAYGMGFAPDSRTRLRAALPDVPVAQLVEAGLLIAVDDDAGRAKEPYDRFRGRVMIPIRDPRGRVIAFGGRILGPGEPKYLNSPDTPLFDKGRTLFNLDRAAPSARAHERIVVVEGYMDVIALAQAGIAEAVAPLGTALTEAQIGLLWRYAPVPVLCFDGDAAGQKAAMRAALRALPLLRPGFSLSFATLPPGQDPDDLVRAEGAEGMLRVLSAAEPLVDRLWNAALAAGPLDTPEQRAMLKSRLSAYVADMADADVAFHYRAAFRERHDALFAPAAPAPHQRPDRPAFQRGGTGGRWPARRDIIPPPHDDTRAVARGGLEAALSAPILAGLLRHPALLARQAETLAGIHPANPADDALLHAMLDATLTTEGLDTEGLLAILAGTEVYNRALRLLRADGLHFSFNRVLQGADNPDAAAHDAFRIAAARDLEELIGLAVEWPELKAATARLDRRIRDTWNSASDEDGEAMLAEQARLAARGRQIEARLAALREHQAG